MKNILAVSLKSKVFLRVLIGVIILLITAGSYLFYQQQADALRLDKFNYLKAIAVLKESQISNWLQERNANAKVFAQEPFFMDGINRWLKDTSNVILKEVITNHLKQLQEEFNYENVFIANKYGDPLLSATDSLTEINTIINQKIAEASIKREIVITDFYHNQKEEKIYYDIIVPIYSEKKLSAVIIFRIDPSVLLFPLIQNWPTPSKSAETILLRVENDSLVFLNELRFNKNTALKFKIPLSRTEALAVQATLGRSGLFEGIDYRGIKVLSYISIIPGANWIMISKIDKSEIFAGFSLLVAIISGFTILLIIVFGTGFAFIYNTHQEKIFMELYSKEKELWGQQEKFKVTLDSLGEGIITLDVNGKVQYMNNIAEEMTEWNLKEARGRELYEIYAVKNEETGQRENNILDKIYQQGIVKELGNNTILISKSGKEIPVMDTGAPVYDYGENIIGVVISFQDVTEKRHQHRQLEKSEKRYRLLVDSIPELSILVFDSNLRFIVAGGEEISKSGFNKNSVEGQTLSEAFPPDVEKLFAPLYDKALKGESTSFDHQYGDFHYHQMVLPIHDSNGNIFGGMVISRNITKFKLDEIEIRNLNSSLEIKIKERTEQLFQAKTEADRANVAKSEFLSRMSHELRTPLNSILGFSQLLNRTETNPERKNRIKRIMNSGMHLLDLINEVLELARIESGRISLSLEALQLSGIIAESLDIIYPMAEEREVKLELAASPFNDLFVKADRQKLIQVLINLINNSVKYNRQGGEVEVSITTSGENIRINIRDTGIGIAAEDIQKLFEPFQRIGAEVSEVEGTGLGLAVAKKLVVAMKGNIGVESLAGIGSTFWIELPQTESQLKRKGQTRDISKTGNHDNTRGGTILYIEDNISNIQLVEDILGTERPNVTLITEMYGKNAVKMATVYKPGIILLDLDLPDTHGSEVLKLLQAEPASKDIPVVILSADAMTHTIDQLMAAGANDYLTKPLDVDKFLEVVDEFLYK